MRKVYIKPTTEVIVLETESQMMSASNFIPESGDNYGGDYAGTNNRRRGKWGNLWAEP